MVVSKDKIEIFVKGVIEKATNNKDLLKALQKEFYNKGLNTLILNSIFEEETRWDLVDEKVQIAFIQTAYNILKLNELNPQEIFSEQALNEYQMFKGEREDIVDILKFNALNKKEDNIYYGTISFKDLYMYRKNGLLFYNSKTQRASEIKTIGKKGEVIRRISINENSVEEIKEKMLKKQYHSDMIILNCRVIEDKEMNFRETCLNEEYNLYDIEIKPNYDIYSENQTVCDIVDGFHRIIGAYKAVEEYKKRTNKWLDGYLFVQLVVMTEEDASSITEQTFQRSDTDSDWKAVLKSDDYTKFVDRLIPKIKMCDIYLSEYVANTYNEYKVYDMLTHKSVLIKAIKNINISVESKSKSALAEKQLSETLNDIFDYLLITYFDGDLKAMKKTHLLDCNCFFGYILLANAVKKEGYDKLTNICDKLYRTFTDKNFNSIDYRLDTKTFNVATVKKLFMDIM